LDVPIPDHHRPIQTPVHPWQAAHACGETVNWRITEDRAAAYSRLQERGSRLQIAVRGSVRTAPCTLSPGIYRFQWEAEIERAGSERGAPDPSLLQVSVWEHPPEQPSQMVRARFVQIDQEEAEHYELIRVTRSTSLSLEIRWLNGPGAPAVEGGEPTTALALSPQVRIREEAAPSLGQRIAVAWHDTVYRFVRR
jgi:hypothetical protein